MFCRLATEGLGMEENVALTRAHVPDVHFDADKEKRSKVEKVLS